MEHILRRGETPEILSVRYGIPVCMLMKFNRGNRMSVGSRLIIPEINACKKETRSYTVREGDTLFEIAQKNHTTMYDLCIENPEIAFGGISQGTELHLPAPMRIYTCEAGDSIASVCGKLGVSEEELRSCNVLENGLYQGLQLRVPNSQL